MAAELPGLNISYTVQPQPDGIAQALLIADGWLAGQPCALVLGYKLTFGEHLTTSFGAAAIRPEGAEVFAGVAYPRGYSNAAQLHGHMRRLGQTEPGRLPRDVADEVHA